MPTVTGVKSLPSGVSKQVKEEAGNNALVALHWCNTVG